MSFSGKLLCCSAVGAIACVAQPAQAQTRIFDIPEQKATAGLQTFSRQADVQLLSARRDTEGKRTNAVRGTMTADQALERLLAGSGLTVRRAAERIFTIGPTRGMSVSELPISLVPAGLQVQGTAENTQAGLSASPPDVIEKSADGETIVVTGTFQKALTNAFNEKRKADQVVDVVSAEDLGKLPDISIAESIARLTRCLIPWFDGAILSLEWKEALWDRHVTGAPRPRTSSEQQYSDPCALIKDS